MQHLTEEQYNELPDYAKDAFAKDGDKYIPAKDATLKNTLNELDGKYKTLESQLTQFQQAEAEKIEAAKKAAFEEAMQSNDKDKLNEVWQQKMADLEKRSNGEVESLRGVIKSVGDKMAQSLVDSLSSHATDEGKAAFALLVKSRIQVDPETGSETYLNADGSASSLDKNGFIAELKKDPVFKPIMLGEIPNGNGILGGGASKLPGKDPKTMTSAERLEFKQRDPDGFKKAFNL